LDKYILDIQDFSCGYGAKFSLKNINIKLTEGCFAGIIGPNGAGKTTLFRGLSNELVARSGEILINDKVLKKLSYKEKAQNIAVVTQTIEQAAIKVKDYVLMGRLPYQGKFNFFETKKDYAIAEEYMKLTNVWQLKDKMMNEISGGEQQLAGIARALTQEPKLLLLDEPTAHLDITHQVQVLNLIQELNRKLGLTVLMNIHDLNLAGEYCDFIVMMKNGEIHTQGTPEEVLNYKNIENVYNTVVVTKTNPVSKKPAVFLVSGQTLIQNKE
jgi:iron complex transport system ATP-binding protein